MDKTEKECGDVVEKIISHIFRPDTKVNMFSWSLEALPDGSDYGQLQENLDAMVKQKVVFEIRDRIQNFEGQHLREFIEHLFRDECYTISNEINEIESSIYGNVNANAECQHVNWGVLNDTGFTFNMRMTVFPSTTTQGLVPISDSESTFPLPVRAGIFIKDKIKNMTQMNKYRKDKLAFANERAEVYLKQLSEDLPVEKIKAILLQSIKEKVDHFFSDVLLKKLSSIKALITNIENDLRESATIRATSQKVEGLLRPIYGRVLASEIDVFGENCIKTSDFSDVKEKGDMIFVSFNFKNTTKHSVLKKVTFSGREDGWKYLAGIHAFRYNVIKKLCTL